MFPRKKFNEQPPTFPPPLTIIELSGKKEKRGEPIMDIVTCRRSYQATDYKNMAVVC